MPARRDAAKSAIGFGSTKREGDDEEAINRLFTPEFRNRLDAIIPFGALPTPVIHQVVREVRHAARGAAVRARRHLRAVARMRSPGWPTRAIDERMGARPLAASSRSTSRSRWPTKCCSASSRMAERSRSRSARARTARTACCWRRSRTSRSSRNPHARRRSRKKRPKPEASKPVKPAGKGKGTPRSGTVPKVPLKT